MKRYLLLVPLLSLGACAQYAVVNTGPQTIKAITVTPSNQWNKVPAVSSIAGLPTWTADGVSLNSISFISDVKSGETLVRAGAKEQYPVFKADMLPTEVVELIESTLAKAYDAKVTERGQLRPLTIGGAPGFEFSFEFVTPDDLPRKGYVAGAVKDERLQVIFYQAARMYYFDSRFQDVKSLVAGAVLN